MIPGIFFLPASNLQGHHELPPGREDDLKSRTPLGVALTPADHAHSYLFLASDAARGVTGTFLHPDGGIGVKG